MAGRYDFHRGTTESFRVTLRRGTGRPIPLGTTPDAAAVTFWMGRAVGPEVIVDYVAADVLEGLVIPSGDREYDAADPTRTWGDGVVEYVWDVGETDEPGVYRARFRVVPLVGGDFYVPNEDNFTIQIN